jgi:uncharacterized membrane protein YcaP (DUF421 family)
MMSFTHYLLIAGKSVIIYLFIVVAIRVFGKKELAQLSVMDLVFILLISNSVQNAMVGNDNSVQGGIAAAIGLFGCNYVFKLLMNRFSGFSKMVQGEKIVLVVDGNVLQNGLKQATMTLEELQMAVREHGLKDVSDANLVILEVDGNITVVSKDYSNKSVKKRTKKPQFGDRP